MLLRNCNLIALKLDCKNINITFPPNTKACVALYMTYIHQAIVPTIYIQDSFQIICTIVQLTTKRSYLRNWLHIEITSSTLLCKVKRLK